MIYLHTLADAIVTLLQAEDLGESATIVRRRIVTQALEGLVAGEKLVSVIPFGKTSDEEAVGVAGDVADIRIVIQSKLPNEDGNQDGTTADECGQLVEDIARLLVGSTVLTAHCTAAKMASAYDPDKMAALDVFDAIITTTWNLQDDGSED